MMKSTECSNDSISPKSTQTKSSRRSSLTTSVVRRSNPLRQNLTSIVEAMEKFFQASQSMEEEIMLPSRLRDMPIEELAIDQGNLPENWFEIYAFVREIRNQLKSSRPFVSEEKNSDDQQQQQQHEEMRKYSNDDEGIMLVNHDYQYISSASSTASSDDLEQISSTSSICTSYETIKDELKFHYNGLLDSLNQLTSLANRVTEKYRDESRF